MARPLIIAHRGASGYLPEHTLPAAAFAYAQGADFIEQDLVLSRDDVLVVAHDIHLETTTDVAERFPQRSRADGRFYVIDFKWEELRQLEVRERVEPRTGRAVFPRRFPHAIGGPFRLCSMEEQIQLVQGLNRSTGRDVGLYPEIKRPAFHAAEGRDPGAALLTLLAVYGYRDRASNVFVQCFDPAELRRLRDELATDLKLVQLIGDNQWGEAAADFEAMRAPDGLREVARYADGIGPHLGHIWRGRTDGGPAVFTSLVADARAVGLQVHAYTFRADALPAGVESIAELLRLFVHEARVDAVFIDHPDRAVAFRAGAH